MCCRRADKVREMVLHIPDRTELAEEFEEFFGGNVVARSKVSRDCLGPYCGLKN